MSHFLSWYIKDEWMSGYVCGIYAMFFGRMIVDVIWPKRKTR